MDCPACKREWIRTEEIESENVKLRSALKSIAKELGCSPTLFEKTKDYYYQNPSVRIETALDIITKTLESDN